MTRASGTSRWVYIGLGVYALVVAVILLAPVSYSEIVNAIDSWIRSDLGITFFGSGWIEFVANILMFVPLGLLLTLLLRHHWYGVILALVISVAAELAQAFIPSRQPSLRDVLANVLGAAIGAGIAWIVVLRRERRSAEPIAADSY